MNKNVFNTEGDFITSPEISQLFGEMIGIWLTMFLEKKNLMDGNKQKTVVEIGPGTGNLQKVVLNILRQFGLLKNLTVKMVEVSPFLRNLQQSKINDFLITKDIFMEYNEDIDNTESLYNKDMNFKIVWYPSYMKYLEMDKISDPLNTHIFLCHEFFDALPCLKFRYSHKNWHEVLLDDNNSSIRMDDNHIFRQVLSTPNSSSVNLYLKPEHRFGSSDIIEGQNIEICPMGNLSRCFSRQHY